MAKAIKSSKKKKVTAKKTKEPKIEKVVETEQPWDVIPLNSYRMGVSEEKEPMTLWQKIKDYFWV